MWGLRLLGVKYGTRGLLLEQDCGNLTNWQTCTLRPPIINVYHRFGKSRQSAITLRFVDKAATVRKIPTDGKT